jgi:hypothetical protein
VAGYAIHEQPWAPLPNPVALLVGGAWLIAGQGVVETDYAADDEAAVGYIVGVAGGPLFDHAVEQKGADFERILDWGGSGRVADFGIWHFAGCAQRYSMDFAWSGRCHWRRGDERRGCDYGKDCPWNFHGAISS